MKRKHKSDNRLLVCDQCQLKCSSPSHLTRHKRTHTGEKPFSCNQCKFKCSLSGNLTRHKRSHTGEKPFACEQCEYKCSISNHLKTHQNTHTREKPFACEQCEYKCSQSSNLTAHKRTHTTEKPFQCDHCLYTSAYARNIGRHMQMHEKQLDYVFCCNMQDGGDQLWTPGDVLCSIRCETARHLDYHIQRNHTKEGIAAKFYSEQKLDDFFRSKGISFDRDRMNFISFQNCKNIEGGRSSSRPDFYLHEKSAELGVLFFVCNDEFCHRQTKCDFQRIFNSVTALSQTKEFESIQQIVFVRFNPHFYRIDDRYFDPPLHESHEKLFATIQSIKKEDLNAGVNLVYVNYDVRNGNLSIFQKEEKSIGQEENVTFYEELYKDCVIKVVN